MCMYKFIVRRSRSWVICLVWKVEMFLPADVLARCSWHESGLCSVYCLIGKVLPHLQKQAIRKLVVINRQFELTQRKSKTHSKTSWRFRVLLLRRWRWRPHWFFSAKSWEKSMLSVGVLSLLLLLFLPSFLQSSQVNSQELFGRKRPNPACKLQNRKKEFSLVMECRQVSWCHDTWTQHDFFFFFLSFVSNHKSFWWGQSWKSGTVLFGDPLEDAAAVGWIKTSEWEKLHTIFLGGFTLRMQIN